MGQDGTSVLARVFTTVKQEPVLTGLRWPVIGRI